MSDTPSNGNRRKTPAENAEQRITGRAQRKLAKEQEARRTRVYTILAALGAVLVVVVLLFVFARQGEAGPPVATAPALAETIPVDGRTMGDPNAPVKVLEYGDYQCPGCGNFNKKVKPDLIKDYVETGKVFFEFRDYAFIGAESKLAAEAAVCAADQNKFWAFHDTVFANQGHENAGSLSADRLRTMAETIGLDMAAYDACLKTDKPAETVANFMAEARAKGVDSTPSVFVNDTKIPWTGYEGLKEAIDKALAEQS